MVDLLIRKRGGWDDGGKNRLGMGGWGGDADGNGHGDGDMMIIMKRYLLMIVGCVIYIDICYQGFGGGRVFLAQIYR